MRLHWRPGSVQTATELMMERSLGLLSPRGSCLLALHEGDRKTNYGSGSKSTPPHTHTAHGSGPPTGPAAASSRDKLCVPNTPTHLAALEVKFGDFRDQNGQREWAVEILQLFAPKSHNNLILSFWLPVPAPWPRPSGFTTLRERCSEDSLAPFPHYRHYSPPPFNCLCNALYRH